MPESRFEFQHSGSPSEKAALEEKAEANFLGRSFGAGGVGVRKSPKQHEPNCGLAVVLPGGRRIEVHPDFDTSTFERLVGILERA